MFCSGFVPLVLEFLPVEGELSRSGVAPAFFAQVGLDTASKGKPSVSFGAVAPASVGSVLDESATGVVESLGAAFTVEQFVFVVVEALSHVRLPAGLELAGEAERVGLVSVVALVFEFNIAVVDTSSPVSLLLFFDSCFFFLLSVPAFS